MSPAATAQPRLSVFSRVSSVHTWAGSSLRASPSWKGLAARPDLSHQLSPPFVPLGGTSKEPEYVEPRPWFSGTVCHLGSSSPGSQGRPCPPQSKENQNVPARTQSIPGQEKSISLSWKLARVTGHGPGHSDHAPAWVGQSWVTASACFQGEKHHISPAHLAILLLPSPLFILVRPRRPGGRHSRRLWREPSVLHPGHPWPSCPRCETPWASRCINELLLSETLQLGPAEEKTQQEHKHLWLTSSWRTGNLLL